MDTVASAVFPWPGPRRGKSASRLG